MVMYMMVCKKCGNVIKNGTYCLRCGTQNDENVINNQLEEIKEEISNESIKKYKAINAIKKCISFVAIVGVIYFFMDLYFDACVAKVGHSECGLGTLCDRKCMPPFFYTTLFVFVFSLIAAFFIIPYNLIIIIKENHKSN